MTVEELRAIPGRVGLWSMELRSAGQAEVRDAASELDGLGFRALWIPGGDGTRVFGDLGPQSTRLDAGQYLFRDRNGAGLRHVGLGQCAVQRAYRLDRLAIECAFAQSVTRQ